MHPNMVIIKSKKYETVHLSCKQYKILLTSCEQSAHTGYFEQMCITHTIGYTDPHWSPLIKRTCSQIWAM